MIARVSITVYQSLLCEAQVFLNVYIHTISLEFQFFELC